MVARLTGARTPGTAPSHPLADYVGTYARPGYEPARVSLEEGRLALTFNGWHVPLAYFAYDTFTLDDVLGELHPASPCTSAWPRWAAPWTAGHALNTEPGCDLVRSVA